MENFASRHIGPRAEELPQMLSTIGVASMDELIDKALPANIRLPEPIDLPEGITEAEYLKKLGDLNRNPFSWRYFIGMGYYNTSLPAVIQRNILENPSWYTSYTPYQAEISQGRLEALFNFQTAVIELTGMDIANASLLDEASAAAEAMLMFFRCRSREAVKRGACRCFVDRRLFPQTIDVMCGRAEPQGIEVIVGDYQTFNPDESCFCAFVQYPDINGEVCDYRSFVEKMHNSGVAVGVAADLLSLSLLTPPGEWDADVAVGSAQRFGLPLGFGGPHAAYFATRDKFKRDMPGRIIGLTVNAQGKRAFRMALQTREQHIKRERATSNICTSQALLAMMAGMYAIYHGPQGLREIAERIHQMAVKLAKRIADKGFTFVNKSFFDTLTISVSGKHAEKIMKEMHLRNFAVRYEDGIIGISVDETCTDDEIDEIAAVFEEYPASGKATNAPEDLCVFVKRKSEYLKQKVFNSYRSETELMRYIKRLERRDISLTHSMIPLGSCTMKLNAAAEMLALSLPEITNIHPFAPKENIESYSEMLHELERQLCAVTGFDAVSFQPNSGATGEYAGLMVIRAYLRATDEAHRNVTLIPSSAHGTNPASAAMAGMEIVIVPDDGRGNIDVQKLRELAEQHKERLAALMITYPSTHGVFEASVREITDIIHHFGGLVYMDGANMNAQVGLTAPAFLGADVCHLNLHKTFAMPHGGGGPGMGPICVAKHLKPYLPHHVVTDNSIDTNIRAIGASQYGSASILPIAWAYISMMGGKGLKQATEMAILNANYLAAKLRPYYGVLYTNENGMVAHEMILQCKQFADTHITATDIAKRLMDYGFHAPTLSFPVANTLMVEPTESESLQELDRFADALISIYGEIQDIINGKADADDNLLKNAPHTEEMTVANEWTHPYTREQAAYPLEWIRENKFWPASSRIDDAFGDRNLKCKWEE